MPLLLARNADVVQPTTITHFSAADFFGGLPAGPVLGQLWAVPDSSSAEALPAQPQQLHCMTRAS
jgi:hypothetical protein